MDAIKKLLAQVNAYWSGKSKAFQRNVIIVAVAAVAVIAILSAVLSHVEYAPLYANLSAQESGELLQTLNTMGEPARANGSVVEVPAANVDRLRMTLSAQNFPRNAKNLDIVSQGQGLMMTDRDKQVYVVAQRESDLQNAIKQFNGIKDAVVNLTVPEDSPLVLQSNRTEARASVILTLDGSTEFSTQNVKAIAQFVQLSVANLKLENISIVDNYMNILDFSDDSQYENVSDRVTLQANVQDRLQRQVLALLQPVLGMGRVACQVHAVLGFDDETTESITFEPPVAGSKEGIPVAIERIRETIKNNGAGAQPGTDTNTGTPTYPVLNTDNGTYTKNQEKINYELNSIKKTIVKEKGAIKELSVSVVLDSTDQQTDLTEDVKNLVATAVGVSLDNITVASLPMNGSAAVDAMAKAASEQAAAALKAQQMRYYIAIGAIVLLILVAMLLIFRNRAMVRKSELAAATALAEAARQQAEEEQQDMETAAAIALVGESETKTQIGKFIETNPELVTNLLRSWLADDQE